MDTPRPVSFHARALLLAASALLIGLAEALALAQADAPPRPIETLQTQIAAIEQRDGENAEALIEPLITLGRLYREDEKPLLAQAAFQNALSIMRVNRGLHTLDQAPLVRLMIENAEEGGDAKSAWDLEQGLLELAERYPDALQSARILRDTADRRVDIYTRYDAGGFPPEIVLGCYYADLNVVAGSPVNCNSGSRRDVQQRLAHEAQYLYSQAINIALRNAESAGDELPALLTDLVESSYRFGDSVLGRRSLSYLLAYQVASSESWLTRIETLVQIADWDLLYSVGLADKDAALAEYAKAYELAKDNGISEQDIARLFSPATPVVLPTFWPSPLVSKPTAASQAHIDAAFQLDAYGKTQRVKTLEGSGFSRVAAKRLEQSILRSQFRPRLVDGRFAGKTPATVRYYSSE